MLPTSIVLRSQDKVAIYDNYDGKKRVKNGENVKNCIFLLEWLMN